MRAVVDANIWVSALLKPDGTAGQVGNAYREGRFTTVISQPMLVELAETMMKPSLAKLGLHPEDAAELIELLGSGSEFMTPTQVQPVCRDPDDDIVIATAVEGKADYLISNDNDLIDSSPVIMHLTAAGVQLVTAAQFLGVLRTAAEPQVDEEGEGQPE